MKIVLEESPRKDKKWRAIFSDGKKVDFGARGMLDFTQHQDQLRKQRFLQRFNILIQKYKNDPQAAMTLSAFLLWNRSTIKASLKDYKQHFGLQ